MTTMLLLASLIAAHGNQPINCETTQDEQELNICAHRSFLSPSNDTDLGRLYQETRRNAFRLDRAVDHRVDRQPSYVETLDAAQAGWVAYRNAQCQWESFEARGGPMQRRIEESCRARMTRQRTRELQD